MTSPTSKIQSVEDLENQINLCLPRRAKKTKLRKARERSNAQCTVSSDEEKLLDFLGPRKERLYLNKMIT